MDDPECNTGSYWVQGYTSIKDVLQVKHRANRRERKTGTKILGVKVFVLYGGLLIFMILNYYAGFMLLFSNVQKHFNIVSTHTHNKNGWKILQKPPVFCIFIVICML